MSERRPIRVLVADDSPTARELLVAVFSSDPAFAVIGQARHGQEVVEMARRLRPDVVVTDVNMPCLDGFEASKQIMAESPVPIVVVSSTLDVGDVNIALHALRAGALAVFPKPEDPRSPDFEANARRFLDTVRLMSDVKVVRLRRTASAAGSVPPSPAELALKRKSQSRLRVVAVATSTGGPAALYRILADLSAGFSLPILVVQHIASGFLSGLAAWLGTASAIRVKIAEDGELLSPKTLYLAPEERHLAMRGDNRLALLSEPPIRGFRPSGTILFRSVARAFGRDAVALILTGMGDDGVEGLRAVRESGGFIVAEAESSCAVYGMPGAAVAAGIVDVQLSRADLGVFLSALDVDRKEGRP